MNPRERAYLSDDPRDPRWRLRIEEDVTGSGLFTVAQETLTLPRVDARATGILAAMDVTSTHAIWLWQALGELIEKAPLSAENRAAWEAAKKEGQR